MALLWAAVVPRDKGARTSGGTCSLTGTWIMARAIDQLYEEHHQVRLVLAGLTSLAQQLHRGGGVDGARAGTALEVLRVFVDRVHHRKEEDHLFDAMGRHGLPPTGFPIAVLHAEHHQGRAHVSRMAEALALAAAGDPGARRGLMREAFRYVALLEAHIRREEPFLFALAQRDLSAEEDAALAAIFAAIEQREVGEEGLVQYRAWSRELAASM